MGARDVERVEQADGITGEEGDRVRGVGLVGEPGPAVIIGDDLVSFRHFPDKLRVPGGGRRAQPHNQQQGLAPACDLVVQVDAVDVCVWHSSSFYVLSYKLPGEIANVRLYGAAAAEPMRPLGRPACSTTAA